MRGAQQKNKISNDNRGFSLLTELKKVLYDKTISSHVLGKCHRARNTP